MGHPLRIPRDRPAGRPQPGYRRPQAHCALPGPLTSWPSNIQVVTGTTHRSAPLSNAERCAARSRAYGAAVTLGEDERAFLERNHSAAMITIERGGLPRPVRVGVALVDGKLWSSGTQGRV